YHAQHEQFPLGSENKPKNPLAAPRITFMFPLYPFLEQDAAYKRFDVKAAGSPDPSGIGIPWCNSPNTLGQDAPTAVVVPSLLCPSDGLGGQTSRAWSLDDGALLGTWNNC